MLVVLKIKSIKQPDKVWDNHNHFLMYTQDRKIMKSYHKLVPKDDPKFSIKGFRAVHYLTQDKKNVIHVYFGTKELWEFDWKYHWLPHKENGIWEIEKLAEENVILPRPIDKSGWEEGLFDWDMFTEWARKEKRK